MTAHKVCCVDECDRRLSARGLCRVHYQRWQKTGSALTPTRTRSPSADVQGFFQNTIALFDGDECLTWPFARTADGYCVMRLNGKTGIVSKYVCERFNGPPPTPEHQAAHSCSNGHLGCVNRKHLSWMTPAENTADRIANGRRIPGGQPPGRRKLSPDDIDKIVKMRGSLSQKEIGRRFGVGQTAISNIFSGKTWGDGKLRAGMVGSNMSAPR